MHGVTKTQKLHTTLGGLDAEIITLQSFFFSLSELINLLWVFTEW